jgi:hypothetical protein
MMGHHHHHHLRLHGNRINFLALNKGYKLCRSSDGILYVFVFTPRSYHLICFFPLQALKRRSSVLDNDIGSVGPIRRIRQKPNLLSSRGLSFPVSGSPFPIPGTGVSSGSAQYPSSLTRRPPLFGESKENLTKMSTENGDNSMPGTSFQHVSSKSSDMASKILQQLEKLVSPKEKSSELKLASLWDSSPSKLSPSMLRGKALRSLDTVESPKLLENVSENHRLDSSLDTLLPETVDITSQKQNKVEENGPLKLVASCDRSVPVVNGIDSKAPNKDTLPSVKFTDSVVINSVNHPPQKKRAFQMSAHEVCCLFSHVCFSLCVRPSSI